MNNNKFKLGVICPAEIAIRRFMPALMKCDGFIFAGVGVCTEDERDYKKHRLIKDIQKSREAQYEKAASIVDKYGGRLLSSYMDVVSSDDVDAVYIPLPPALHYKWAKLALKNGKHVLVEKPSTLFAEQTADLIGIAKSSSLALHENYMFIFHSQLDSINNIVKSGEIGEVYLYRISFGFPRRAQNDFRYCRQAGGGALLDAGGYTLKYASRLLGNTARLVQAQVKYIDGFKVDIFGTAVMVNAYGATAQLAFGMDNDYKCELEVWGSKGTLYTNRVLTAPVGYSPIIRISKNGAVEEVKLEPDDAFRKSLLRFKNCIDDEKTRNENMKEILIQSRFVDEFRKLAGDERLGIVE